MGWKGALRSYAAMQRRAARAERRALREAARAEREALRQAERDAAEALVARYELQLRLLGTVHHECGPVLDWNAIAAQPEPPAPVPVSHRTEAAEAALVAYRPGLFARLFGTAVKRRAALEEGVQRARQEDAAENERARTVYEQACRDLARARSVADAILRRDAGRYPEALDGVDAFDELEEVGATVWVRAPRGDAVVIDVTLPPADVVVPDEQLSVTQRGKLSTKGMPKRRHHEIYQDYVCGAALRAAREAFAALPIDTACVTVLVPLTNPATGHTEPQPVLSLLATRPGIDSLKYESLDPSEAMSNFVHRMGFKKTAGMAKIEALELGDSPAPTG